MNRILNALIALALTVAAGCSSGDPCAKLTKDICGDKGPACADYVKKDLLEGKADKSTCEFLTKDADYQKWLGAAKKSVAKGMK